MESYKKIGNNRTYRKHKSQSQTEEAEAMGTLMLQHHNCLQTESHRHHFQPFPICRCIFVRRALELKLCFTLRSEQFYKSIKMEQGGAYNYNI